MSRASFFWLILGGLALTACAFPATAYVSPGPLHIHALHGSVVRVGSINSGGARYPLYGVHLEATVCVRSAAEARRTYLTEIGTTHFAVSVSPPRWRPVRIVRDRAPWLVPLGETWAGKACGPVVVDDPIPPEHLGAESLSNPNGCYGVALTIRAGTQQATKRVIVKCGAVGGG